MTPISSKYQLVERMGESRSLAQVQTRHQKEKKKKEEEEMKYIIEIKIQGQYASLYALKCF